MPKNGDDPAAANTTVGAKKESALHQMLSPDGYYTYLNIEKPPIECIASTIPTKYDEKKDTNKKNGSHEVDVEEVKKKYRRLSLQHHPDRRGGDSDTFRVLNRAKLVLITPTLRKQYDLLGLDLEEDETDDTDDRKDDQVDGSAEKDDTDSNGSSDSAMSQLASACLACIMQFVIRTVMMTVISTILSRFKILVAGMIIFLAYTSFQIYASSKKHNFIAGKMEVASPLLIGLGLVLMYIGRNVDSDIYWSFSFWLGESTVLAMFIYNSIPNKMKEKTASLIGFTFISVIVSLFMKGKFWRYICVISIELGLALVSLLVFPIMEMIIEEIMNEKLKKIGEKVRSHAKRMEELRINNKHGEN